MAQDNVYWKKSRPEFGACFVGIFQVNTDDMAKSLGANGALFFLIRWLLLNITKDFWRYVLDRGYVLIRLPSVFAAEIVTTQKNKFVLKSVLGVSIISLLTDILCTKYSMGNKELSYTFSFIPSCQYGSHYVFVTLKLCQNLFKRFVVQLLSHHFDCCHTVSRKTHLLRNTVIPI